MSRVTWFGHSAFKIECGGASVLIDPFFAPATGLGWQDAGPVDMVLITHDHGDHVGDAVGICQKWGSALGAIVGTAQAMVERGVPEKQILNGIGFNIGGSLSHKGITATMTQAFHSSDSGAPAGYIVRMPDGRAIYHAGDTGIFSTMGLLGSMYPLDLALLPVGGVFTMDAEQAAHACKLLNCGMAIPMHWGTFPVLAQSPDEFLEKAATLSPSCKCVAMKPGESLEIK